MVFPMMTTRLTSNFAEHDDFHFLTISRFSHFARYDRDLFYIAPFYHLELSQVKKLIVVDLDIEFHCRSQFSDERENVASTKISLKRVLKFYLKILYGHLCSQPGRVE